MADAEPVRLGRWAPFLPVGIAAVLGALFLGRKGFTSDEAVSVTLARLPWHRFGDLVVHRETNGSLYFTLLHLLTRGDGGEWGARAIPFVCFVGATAVLFLLARRLFGTRIATLAGAFFAVNPLYVEYAQTSREYLLAVFLVVTSTYLFVRGVQDPSPLVWAAYAVVSAAGAYAFLLTAAVPVAQVLSLAALPARRVPWRNVAYAVAGWFLLLVPLLVMLSQSRASGGVAWASGNLPGRVVVSLRGHFPRGVLVLLFGALTVVLAFAWWRLVSRLAANPHAWRWVLLASWLLVPSYLVTVAAFIWQPLFIVRYFLVFAPPLLVALAALVMRLPRVGALALGAAVIVVSVGGVVRWYSGSSGADYRGASAYVAHASAPGDGVLFYAPFVRMPFELYFSGTARSRVVRPVYPADPWSRAPARFVEAVPMPRRAVAAGLRPYRRVWLVLSQYRLYGGADPGYDNVVGALHGGGFKLVQERSYPGVVVRRYSR